MLGLSIYNYLQSRLLNTSTLTTPHAIHTIIFSLSHSSYHITLVCLPNILLLFTFNFILAYRFGENAGEATEHVFATAGHAANTAWNVFKIRKAITPASSATGGILKSAAKNRSFK